MKVRGKHITLAFVLLVAGFIIALSYELTTESFNNFRPDMERQWKYEDELREQILEAQAENSRFQEELDKYHAKVREMETSLTTLDEEQEIKVANLVDDIERLRKIVGNVAVKGQGLEVSLEDADYLPDGENPNNYIVHEAHVQLVVEELLVSGAEAIAVNGQRLSHQSFIQCVGPVILVDGQASNAPFVISAIGDPETLEASMSILGGVQEQLVNDGIKVRIQPKDLIELDAYLSEKG